MKDHIIAIEHVSADPKETRLLVMARINGICSKWCYEDMNDLLLNGHEEGLTSSIINDYFFNVVFSK